jgi:hypothetical protein
VVGTDLTVREPSGATPGPPYQVTLVGGERASGLADMLHQFLSQNLEELPGKVRQARRLDGKLLFRSAEDPDVCVRIWFCGDHIEIQDHQNGADGLPSITSDFLSTAHLTTGEEGPFALVAKRKIRVSFAPRQTWFLISVLRFMKIPGDARARRARRVRWALVAVAIATSIALVLWLAGVL